MSGKIMGNVWDVDLSHSHMLVLLALADHANHQGENVHPSLGLIAWKVGYSKRQVQRIVHQLKADGLLIEVRSASAQQPTTYKIDFSKGRKKPPYRYRDSIESTRDNLTPQEMTKCHERDDITMSQRGDTQMSPKPSITLTPDSPTRVAKPMPKSMAETLEKFAQQVRLPEKFTPDYIPQQPLEWADFFLRRCAMSRDRVLRPLEMFRHWCNQGVTIEDVELACQRVEAKPNINPAGPEYYRPIVEQVILEKQRAKENPAATGNSKPGLQKNNNKSRRYYETNRPSGQRLSSAEWVRREGIEYLRRTNQLTDREWSAYLQDIGEYKPDPLNRAAHEYPVDADGRDFPAQMVIESRDYWQQCI